jgi:hypothetical protein
MNLSSLSLTTESDKLECFYLSTFKASLIFTVG